MPKRKEDKLSLRARFGLMLLTVGFIVHAAIHPFNPVPPPAYPSDSLTTVNKP